MVFDDGFDFSFLHSEFYLYKQVHINAIGPNLQALSKYLKYIYSMDRYVHINLEMKPHYSSCWNGCLLGMSSLKCDLSLIWIGCCARMSLMIYEMCIIN